MIETEQSTVIDVDIVRVWNYVKDIKRWAAIMPGYQECEILNDDDSRWVLKVGAGGFSRVIKVDVHVDKWAGPEHVLFSYALVGDPVLGGGTYTAKAVGANQTEISLHVRVEGSGPLATMWETMGRPLLPTFAKAFAEQLGAAIAESAANGDLNAEATPVASGAGASGNWLAWLGALLRAFFARKS